MAEAIRLSAVMNRHNDYRQAYSAATAARLLWYVTLNASKGSHSNINPIGILRSAQNDKSRGNNKKMEYLNGS
jgi:hypothetical protein